MGAPKGNQYWTKRLRSGRFKEYQTADELKEACLEYFEYIIDNPFKEQKPMVADGVVQVVEVDKMRPFTLDGLCVFIGIVSKTFRNYEKLKDFIPITTHIREIMYSQKFEGAAAGFFNSNIIARDLGLSDKKVLDHQSKGEAITGMRITKGKKDE